MKIKIKKKSRLFIYLIFVFVRSFSLSVDIQWKKKLTLLLYLFKHWKVIDLMMIYTLVSIHRRFFFSVLFSMLVLWWWSGAISILSVNIHVKHSIFIISFIFFVTRKIERESNRSKWMCDTYQLLLSLWHEQKKKWRKNNEFQRNRKIFYYFLVNLFEKMIC